MVDANRKAGAAVSVTGTIAVVLAASAIACALLALPGGLVWITIYLPALGVPNEGVLSILANVVTIPAAVTSWLLAIGGVLAATTGLLQLRRDRRSLIALTAAAPGAVLGTVLVVLVVAQLGSALQILPNNEDLQRQADAQAVAAHLALPEAGPRLIARCEGKDGPFQQRRVISVVEQWSQPRLDQIRGRLNDYSVTAAYPPHSPSDRQKINYLGKDPQGKTVQVFVDRFPAGSTLPLGCGQATVRTEAMRTTVYVGSF